MDALDPLGKHRSWKVSVGLGSIISSVFQLKNFSSFLNVIPYKLDSSAYND
jgi:hypothetical protein